MDVHMGTILPSSQGLSDFCSEMTPALRKRKVTVSNEKSAYVEPVCAQWAKMTQYPDRDDRIPKT